MCHTGYLDGDLAHRCYGRQREVEFAGLADPVARDALRAGGVELIRNAALRGAPA